MRTRPWFTTSVKDVTDKIDTINAKFVQYLIQFANVRRHDTRITKLRLN